jgi:hypothetical protein
MDPCSSYTPSHVRELEITYFWQLIHATTDRYLQLLKENREKGYRGQQQNYIPSVTGPELGGSTGLPDVPGYYPIVQKAMGELGTDKRKGATVGAGKDPY